MSRRAGDGPLVAYVFMCQAQQSADHLDGARAIGLAETAGATAALTDRDRALCAIRQAQGHALRANRHGCAAAIKTAYRLVARADDTGVDEDPDTIGRHCGLPYVQAREACCQLRLGHPADAVNILEEILTGWPADYRQDEGLARAWLALSYAAANRPADAGVEGSRALALTTVTWSARTMRALGQLQRDVEFSPRSCEIPGRSPPLARATSRAASICTGALRRPKNWVAASPGIWLCKPFGDCVAKIRPSPYLRPP